MSWQSRVSASPTRWALKCPSQLSIASFDDSVLTRLTHPAITSLTRDTFALGSLAAERLLAAITAERATPESVQAPTPQLVVRGSTAPPRSTER
ncbi:substrate-binding domain-containing protein [Microbacterium murale]|uniref:substrate-binding domain-containing protein n=1 Tax=Microbacterium murale TaxID=1081040 RepID=UPI0027D8479E|nr:substrate-binding domain-containing protein [Microbacterium murale]